MRGMRRLRSRWLLLVAIVLVPVIGQAAGPVAPGFGSSEPMVVIDQAGIAVVVVGAAAMQLDPAAGGMLTLDRIAIDGDATFAPAPATQPELYVIEVGALQQQDERGFWSRMEAPYQVVTVVGESLSWTATDDTRVLRLRQTDAAAEDAPQDGVTVERVAQFRVDAFAPGSGLVYIARAALSGRTEGARLEHDGSVGITVETGAIDVVSPSGLEGRLGAGQSAHYPDGAPITFVGAAEGDPAIAWLVGLSTSYRTLEGPASEIGTNSATPLGGGVAASPAAVRLEASPGVAMVEDPSRVSSLAPGDVVRVAEGPLNLFAEVTTGSTVLAT